jgi:hypothetical protein
MKIQLTTSKFCSLSSYYSHVSCFSTSQFQICRMIHYRQSNNKLAGFAASNTRTIIFLFHGKIYLLPLRGNCGITAVCTVTNLFRLIPDLFVQLCPNGSLHDSRHRKLRAVTGTWNKLVGFNTMTSIIQVLIVFEL